MLGLFLDALFGVFSAAGPTGGGKTSSREAAGLTIFPVLSFVIVLFAEIQSMTVGLIVLPLVFAGLYLLLCRATAVSPQRTIAGTIGCALLCVMTDFLALALVAITSLFLWA